jgi:predicted  nucleic acid-binding Zn-ribbon protein
VEEVHGVQGPLLLKAGPKSSIRNLKNEISTSSQQPERSNSDSLPDSSTSGSEYRVLRRKYYLLLEEESFAFGGELREIEDGVKTLEEEKLALLDQLVVLEGYLA